MTLLRGSTISLLVLLLALAGCTQDPDPAGLSNAGADSTTNAASSTSTGSTTAAANAAQATATQASTGKGSTGSIRGVVVDESIRPIAMATITLDADGASTVSDADGSFTFDGLPAGVYFFTVTHERYFPVQGSANVEAGKAKPEAIRVVLQADNAKVPRMDVLQRDVYISSQFCLPTGCRYIMSGTNPLTGVPERVFANFEDNMTAIQTEISWNPTSPIGERGAFSCSGYGDGGSVFNRTTGPSSLAVRLPGIVPTDEGTTNLRTLSCELLPDGAVSAMVNQQATAIIHVFYNFEPPVDWRFGRDGEPIVPP